MKSKATYAILIVALAALALLVTGCNLPQQDDLELARALLQSLSDSSPAGDYTSSAEAKTVPAPGGIQITLLGVDPEYPPEDGDWTFTLSAEFDGFVPPGYGHSTVTGTVTTVLAISFVKGTATDLSLYVDGELEVAGEHAGTYLFDASLHYDMGTGDYSYSGTVTINGEVHTFKS